MCGSETKQAYKITRNLAELKYSEIYQIFFSYVTRVLIEFMYEMTGQILCVFKVIRGGFSSGHRSCAVRKRFIF